MGKGGVAWPTYIRAGLPENHRKELCRLLNEFMDYFTWEYMEMSGLSQDFVEHTLIFRKI
jgi:hypothetical protein